jgi:hypothetical protein
MRPQYGLVALAGMALLATGGLMSQVADTSSRASVRVAGFGINGGCATPDLSDMEVDRLEQASISLRKKLGRKAPSAAVPLGTVRVYFHCIHDDEGTGLLTEDQIQDQIDALSDKFENLDFVLEEATFTENNTWFHMTPGSAAELAAKTALSVDSSQYLNIYSAGLEGGLGGWAYFPSSQQAQPILDGVVILYTTIPEGGLTNYEEGEICAHEVGHWAGLYHTFQGKCTSTNDRVADTPAERSSASGCPSSRDTCRSAGSDPIHNYMDYTNDVCRTEFTPGQYTRMADQLSLYRPDAIVP